MSSKLGSGGTRPWNGASYSTAIPKEMREGGRKEDRERERNNKRAYE